MKRRLVLAGVPVDVITAYDEYYPYFSPYLEKNGGTTRDIPPCPINDRDIPSVRIPPQRLRKAASIYQPGEPEYYVEYMELCPAVSSAITAFGRIVFHAVSFIWKDLAWLITAPSGTGKSTHTALWLKHFGNRAYMLNDDKPAIRLVGDRVYACGTPWSGKYDYSTPGMVPLAGICFLERAEENFIHPADTKKAVFNIFSQTVRKLGPNAMERLFDMLETIFAKVPLYELGCNISDDAVRTSYNAMKPKGQSEK